MPPYQVRSGSGPHGVVGVGGPVGVHRAHRFAGALVHFAHGHITHGDGVGHGAHGYAQVAAHAFVFLHLKVALAVFHEGDGLVAGVFAGNVAAAALDAAVLVDDGLAHMVEVQVAPVAHGRHGLAHDLVHAGEAHFVHVGGQTAFHFLHDLEAIDHGGGAHLHRARAQRDEVQRVAPVADAADAADGQAGSFRVTGNLGHHVQGNGFDGWAAVATVAALAAGAGRHGQCVRVHTHDGVDGVDQAHRIGTAALGGLGGLADVGDVGREFHDHGQLAVLLAPLGHHLDVLGHLAHGGAHAALAHAVGAAKVQLDAVRTGVFHARQDGLPALLFARHHQRNDHGAVLPVALDLGDLFQVEFQVAVGDQLDVVEAHEAAIWREQRAVARAVDVDHGGAGFAQRFPDHDAPAGFKRAVDVVGLVGGRCRGEPEGVGAFDADEIGCEIGHGVTPVFLRL